MIVLRRPLAVLCASMVAFSGGTASVAHGVAHVQEQHTKAHPASHPASHRVARPAAHHDASDAHRSPSRSPSHLPAAESIDQEFAHHHAVISVARSNEGSAVGDAHRSAVVVFAVSTAWSQQYALDTPPTHLARPGPEPGPPLDARAPPLA
jgi:hypothetical protein